MARRARRLLFLLSAAGAIAASAGHAGMPATGDAARLAIPHEVAVDDGAHAMAGLHLTGSVDGALHAWAENLLDGPVEVLLRGAPGAGLDASPGLPARATVPARGRVLVATLRHRDPQRLANARLWLDAVPGSALARPRDVEYAYPLGSAPLRVTQGWGGATSHADDGNRHAVDFAAPDGTPVLAARDGVVMQVVASFAEATGTRDATRDGERANLVRVLHEDGTMALYAHLRQHGVRVVQGQRVRRGDHIADSGNTGFSAGPHLHFVVQANRGRRLVSVPFRMFGPRGVLRFSDARR